MKAKDVQIGHTYLAKVSGKLVGVRITEVHPAGGFRGINTATGRGVRVKSAGRLREEVTPAAPDTDLSWLPEKGDGIDRRMAGNGTLLGARDERPRSH